MWMAGAAVHRKRRAGFFVVMSMPVWLSIVGIYQSIVLSRPASSSITG